MNAQKELIEHVANRKVSLVRIAMSNGYGEEPRRIEGTLDEVLPQLNFEYDDGFGGQNLFGYIWYEDGTWSDRGEYDGSEWWQHQEVPHKECIIETY